MSKIEIWSETKTYYISTTPQMPIIGLSAVVSETHRESDLSRLEWSFQLRYDHFIPVSGSTPRNIRTKKHPEMQKLLGPSVIVPFSTLMGGNLSVRVEGEVGGELIRGSLSDIVIGGANPDSAVLAIYISKKIVRQLIQQESGGKQFSENIGRDWVEQAINPNWSSDGERGAGLGQLTDPIPTDLDIWNWKINASSTLTRFEQKRASFANLHSRISGSPRFASEVNALQKWRADEKLPFLMIQLPALTEHQKDCEGLRAYNGFGPKVQHQYLPHVHEFEPQTTVLTSKTRRGDGGQLLKSSRVPVINAAGVVSWSQVSGADRLNRYGGKKFGEPNYVEEVLSRPG